MIEIISVVASWILNLVNTTGYFGIFVGMAIESSFFPFPSEVILIPAGFLVAQGKLSFPLILLASVLGSLVGAFVNYFIALSLGRKTCEILLKKYGKFLFLKQSSLNKCDLYFERHGEVTTFVGRLIPVVRQIISLPAGFARMNPLKFTFYTALGAAIWSFVLIMLGYVLGNNLELIQQNLSLLSILFTLFGLALLAYYVYRRPKKKVC